jgi:hypothetical protein
VVAVSVSSEVSFGMVMEGDSFGVFGVEVSRLLESLDALTEDLEVSERDSVKGEVGNEP